MLWSKAIGAGHAQIGRGWEVGTASHVATRSVSAQEGSPTGLFFRPDGLRMYLTGTSGDDVNEYNLSTAWNIVTAVYSRNFSVSAQDSSPEDLFFKDDGTKMYLIGGSGDDVNEYNLSTPWHVSSAVYSQRFSVSAQEASPTGLFFSPDGAKMFITGLFGDDVNEYDLSTAWDVSSAVYVQRRGLGAQDTSIRSVFFRHDGRRMYITGDAGNDINQYNLSTAWNIATAVYSQNFSVSAQDSSPRGLFFSPDGTRMYFAGNADNEINQYNVGP